MEIKEIEIEGDKAYILKNESLEVVVTALGAGILSLKYKGEEMVLTPLHYKDYARSDAYFGKCVGRIAGRVKDGKLVFEGKEYHLSRNEGNNSLHGGENAFSFRYFEGKDEGDALTLSLFSKDGDNGYPGNLSVSIIYRLSMDSLSISFISSSDAITPVNLTNHSYFSLGEDDCKELSLLLKADRVLTYNDDLSIKGEAEVNRCLDFREEKKIGRDILDPSLYETKANGYDHCYLFEKKAEGPQVILRGEKTRLEITTSYPSVVIYSSNYADPSIMANNGKMLHTRNSLAIEPEYPGNDLEAMSVKKGVKKVDTITYSFYKER